MDTRQRILERAREAFATRGYAATSLDDLARELGLTKGAIYHHFPSKRALLKALLDEARARAEAALAREGTLEDRLFAYARAYRDDVEPLTALISARSGRRGADQGAHAIARAAMQEALEHLSAFLEVYAPGEGRVLGAVFFSIVHGAYVLARQAPPCELDRMLETGIRLFARGLSAKREEAEVKG